MDQNQIDKPATIQWTEDMKYAFRHVKFLMCSAPELGLPCYKLTFHLYVAEDGNVAMAVLAQKHGDKLRPVGYYSKMLPLIVKGMVACLRAVAAAAIILLVSACDVTSRADFDQLTQRLKAGHIQKPYLTLNSMDGFFSKFVCVWKHQRHNITPQIPEKVIFS
uniref:Reverse transcriptase/retrotransposon-derived protein RNase H-like domain-containing protein n=1 Tax=Sander lucioperca TaxID=283035 RepID=A0A8C9XXV6_SANLU